jgi:hypothetical protein
MKYLKLFESFTSDIDSCMTTLIDEYSFDKITARRGNKIIDMCYYRTAESIKVSLTTELISEIILLNKKAIAQGRKAFISMEEEYENSMEYCYFGGCRKIEDCISNGDVSKDSDFIIPGHGDFFDLDEVLTPNGGDLNNFIGSSVIIELLIV